MDVNPYQSPIEEGPETREDAEGQFLASRGSRFAASMIDSIASMIVVAPLWWWSGWFETLLRSGGNIPLGEHFKWSAIGFAIWFFLQIAFLRNGQTIGKKMLGIRMVDYETGKPVSVGRLVGSRYLPIQVVASIPSIGPLLSLVDALFIFGSEQRCVHDLLGGTKVVQE